MYMNFLHMGSSLNLIGFIENSLWNEKLGIQLLSTPCGYTKNIALALEHCISYAK